MPPYNPRTICSQLLCLTLTVALLAVPLVGTGNERAPILIPLATELVPLSTSLQSPPVSPFRLPSFATGGKLVLGPLPSPALSLSLDSHVGLRITSPSFRDRRASDKPVGRSPPSA
jgi:hypothetical protein